MKKFITLVTAIFLLTIFVNDSYSQNESDEMMRKWMAYMTPGTNHSMMANFAGNWNTTSTMWMTPGSEPTVSNGTTTGEMIMGGRYLLLKHTGSVMGMPFEGMSIEGFDNATQTFNSVWIDNMGTGIMYSTGKYNEAANQIEYTAKMIDPVSGNLLDTRQIAKFNEDGTMTFEMYMPYEGTEFKSLIVEYKR
jgi:hypothetical protein